MNKSQMRAIFAISGLKIISGPVSIPEYIPPLARLAPRKATAMKVETSRGTLIVMDAFYGWTLDWSNSDLPTVKDKYKGKMTKETFLPNVGEVVNMLVRLQSVNAARKENVVLKLVHSK